MSPSSALDKEDNPENNVLDRASTWDDSSANRENSGKVNTQGWTWDRFMGHVSDTTLTELVPDHHQEPAQDGFHTNFWDRFMGPVPDTIPTELVPDHHQEPTWDDPTVDISELKEFLAVDDEADEELTNGGESILAQKKDQNLSEIAKGIGRKYNFLSVSKDLAVYESPCWKIRNHTNMIRFINAAVREFYPQYASCLSNRQYKEILDKVRLLPNTRQMDRIPAPDYNYLCCQDFMYDWHTGECIPHRSSFYCFSALNMNAEDIGNCESQYWDIFLDNLTAGVSSLRQRVLEIIGVILTGYPTKNFFLLEGESNTGKSQLVNFIRNLLGESACFALNDISQLGDKWTTGSLWGKLLCLCGDVPDAPLSSKAIGTIKQLTGDDLIRGEVKYQNAFTFENTAKLLFVSNYPLKIPSAHREQALLDRLVIIPCRNSIPKEQQIYHLYEHLLEEAGYIVGLALDALIDFEARGRVFTPLSESLEDEAIQAPDAEQSVRDFVKDCCVLEDGAKCAFNKIFERYLDYVAENIVNKKQFSQFLTHCVSGIETYRTNSERGFVGIRLKDDLD